MPALLLTLFVGTLAGLFFCELKIPGGLMIGALVGTAALNVLTGRAYMPAAARIAAQIAAGGFIACTVEKSDLSRLPHLARHLGVLVGGMLLFNLAAGFAIYRVSDMDLLTSLFCAVPGGLSDIPIIAAEMGAAASDVAIAQFARLLAGIGLFPSLILRITKRENLAKNSEAERRQTAAKKGKANLCLTLATAALFGLFGRALGVPAGGLLFSLLAVLALKLFVNKAYLPKEIRQVAQILSGAYIGSTMTLANAMSMKSLLPPVLVLVAGYFAASLLIGAALRKCGAMTLRESMLCATPAGASDLALIYADLGVHNPDLVVLQVVRMILVIAVFPPIIHFVSSLAQA
ncbi:MAG: AbrB family transcriptional regulator [Peptococcaceae bacterium]|jgi:membrane AbrB-like protein|nr:AbrB family transcriptional regulator [Peptococcaceae bacterium]